MKVDPANVTYEPATYDPSTGGVKPGRYLTADTGALVVRANPANQESLAPNGHFELYEGDEAQYEPVVIAS